jgi:hypothetical protein
MYHKAAIHELPFDPHKKRMDLHCHNSNCQGRRSFMGVIMEENKVWECHEYQFWLIHEDSYYILEGHNYSVDPYRQNRDPFKQWTSLGGIFENPFITVDFIPVSTGDDMHERIWELFHRLNDLKLFY